MLLIHFSNNEFKLYFQDFETLTDILEIDNITYYIDTDSKVNNGFIGFFDWLRSDESTIVGIRICYFQNLYYNKLFLKFIYIIKTFSANCNEILFRGNSYRSELSGDQDFSNNYVYVSEKEEYIFTFGTDNLTTKELQSLLNNCIIIGNVSN
jgi:hypothetical protein